MTAEELRDILGLGPGRVDRRALDRAFAAERMRWLAALDDPRRYALARQRLDELHLAYRTMRAGGASAAVDPKEALRAEIAASLEGGLLRYSRRRQILRRGREIGLSDFETHLLMAQTQFDADTVEPNAPRPLRAAAREATRGTARFAAAGVLGFAMFLSMLRWLGV